MKRRLNILFVLLCVGFCIFACRQKLAAPTLITINFVSNCSEVILPITFENQVGQLPQSLTKDGYQFAGWFVDSDCTVPFSPHLATNGMTLYAGWIACDYTVTFFLLGEDSISLPFLYGDSIILPDLAKIQDPAYQEYNFLGWFLDTAYETPLPDDFVVFDSFNVYAKFSEKVYCPLKVVDWDGTVLLEDRIEEGKLLDERYLTRGVLPQFASVKGLFDFVHNGQKIDFDSFVASSEVAVDIVYTYPISHPSSFVFKAAPNNAGYYVEASKELSGEIFLPPSYNGRIVIGTAPSSLTHTSAAFYGKDITSVYFPITYSEIGAYSFYGCSSLAVLGVVGQMQRTFNPSGGLTIGEQAFYACAISKLELPSPLVSIGNGAFSHNYDLISVSLPSSLIGLGVGVFDYCTSIEWIEVQEDNEYFSSRDGNLLSKDGKIFYQYAAGNKSTVFSLYSNVERIAGYAFSSATKLNTLELFYAKNLSEIGEYAFSYCTSLTSIEIPDSVQKIEKYAFNQCFSLNNAILSVDSQLSYIGDYAFMDCASLQKVYLPKNAYIFYSEDDAISGEARAFIGCSVLSQISVSAENPYYYSMGGVLYDKTLSSLLLYPAGKQSEVFQIEETVKEIKPYAVSNSVHLKELILNEGLKVIGGYAFAYSSIERVELPSSLEELALFSFAYCVSLKEVESRDGSRLKTIALGSFWGCDRLESITLTAENPPSDNGDTVNFLLEGMPTKIYVKGEHLQLYKESWPAYASRIELIN